MRARWWILALAASCGRIDFVPIDVPIDADVAVCPDGFVHVLGNAALGTSDFCVMQTEARAWQDADGDGAIADAELDADGCSVPACDVDWVAGTHLPVSPLPVPAQPWRSVSQVIAQAACRALGADFDLIANREWMTIARSAELDGRNWAGGVPGSGRIAEGNTDGSPMDYTGIIDPTDGYSGTGNDASQLPDVGWEQRRTLWIAGDSVIWDMPGNVQEWADWTIGGPLDAPPSCTSGQLPGYSCPGLADDDFQSTTGTYDSSNGVGTVIGGSGNAARRGGQASDRTGGYAGIYGFNMNRFTTEIYSRTGFRCVFRL